jgi:hypothetical protein
MGVTTAVDVVKRQELSLVSTAALALRCAAAVMLKHTYLEPSLFAMERPSK